MRATITAVLVLATAACSAGAGQHAPPGRPAEPGAPRSAPTEGAAALSAAPTSPPPNAGTPAVSDVFSLALKLPEGVAVGVVGDGLGVWVTGEYDEGVMATAFEVKPAGLVKVGTKRIPGGHAIQGLRRFGDAIYFQVVGISGRTGLVEYVPVSDKGYRRNEPDSTVRFYTAIAKLRPPECGSPARDGIAPMNEPGDFIELKGHRGVMVGRTCDGELALQVVDQRAKTHRFISLEARPEMLETNFGLAFEHKGGLVALSDASTLVAIDAPKLPPQVSWLHKAPDGALLARADGKYLLARNGSWAPLALPSGDKTLELVAGERTLWAFAGSSASDAREVYAYVAPGSSGPSLVDASDMVLPARLRAPPPPFTTMSPGPRCPNNLVVLYGFTKVTPDDYDFPLTRRALKGHTELAGTEFAVTEERGQKYFVGKAPSFDAALSLADVIAKGVQGSKPQIVCATPKTIRTLRIDLTTGEVAK